MEIAFFLFVFLFNPILRCLRIVDDFVIDDLIVGPQITPFHLRLSKGGRIQDIDILPDASPFVHEVTKDAAFDTEPEPLEVGGLYRYTGHAGIPADTPLKEYRYLMNNRLQ